MVTDPGVAAIGHPQRIAEQMGRFGIEAAVFDGVHVEPTDESMRLAVEYGRLGIRVNAVAPGFIRTDMFTDSHPPERRAALAEAARCP